MRNRVKGYNVIGRTKKMGRGKGCDRTRTAYLEQ